MIGKIIAKKEVALETLSVTFCPSEPAIFKPGQYCFITLNGERKQFSINNSPSQSDILTITTRVSDSGFKKTLNELPIGSEVELGPIAGIFTLPEDTKKPLVFIAGGIGITPFLSMLKYLEETKLPYKVTLIYSNRNQSSTAYLYEVQQYATNIPINLILTMTDDPIWTGEKRIVDSDFVKEYFPNPNDYLYMVVGPPGMVEAVRKSLSQAGVLEENIKFENFTGY